MTTLLTKNHNFARPDVCPKAISPWLFSMVRIHPTQHSPLIKLVVVCVLSNVYLKNICNAFKIHLIEKVLDLLNNVLESHGKVY